MALKLDHLTHDEHQTAACLLVRIKDDLRELSWVVGRAPFTDQTLRVLKAMQETLGDPLREAASKDGKEPRSPAYTNIGYGVRSPIKL